MSTKPRCIDRQREIADSLLAWFSGNARDLPWRCLQHDPYAVWVSEVMLQQTQVAAVIPYYQRWMGRFPTIDDLARADEQEVLAHWSGLGYYARARNLHRAAKAVAAEHSGRVPSDPAALRALPGIGAYTAGAILSIAFGLPHAVVDGNVERVLSRLVALDGDPKSSVNQKALWNLARSLVPPERPGDFNQALMELGATVCTPSLPSCGACPISNQCAAYKSGEPERWPQAAPARKNVRVEHVSVIVRAGDQIVLVRRENSGLWGGLWENPRSEVARGEDPLDAPASAARSLGLEADIEPEPFTQFQHQVMHFSIRLTGYAATLRSPIPTAQLNGPTMFTLSEAAGLALAAPQRKLLVEYERYQRAQQGMSTAGANE